MDTLAAMQVFTSVVETGGLSAAGRALGLALAMACRAPEQPKSRFGVFRM